MTTARKRNGLTAIAFLLALAGCAVTPPGPEHLVLSPASFDDLSGWGDDRPSQALAAFRRSCADLTHRPATFSLGIGGKAGDWHDVCAAAQGVPDGDDAAARAYFEQNFHPYLAAGNNGDDGLFTGYYVPELNGSPQQSGAFQTPLYARPGDLIGVDLGLFKPELKGQHIVGKVTGAKLVPYDDRAAIAAGSLANRAQPLAWVDDPLGAFFLEVQGSGRIRMHDGTVQTLGYDGVNGHGYVSLGKTLADRGELPRPVTMKSIRAWMRSHPDRAQQMMDANPSYVFFRRLPNQDIIGAEGVALTAQRSIAVDPAFVPLGAPLWLDTTDGQGAPLRRLMVAQDTGGAIKGAVRGDFFWGAGDDAGAQAGAMQGHGRYYLLLPKTVKHGE